MYPKIDFVNNDDKFLNLFYFQLNMPRYLWWIYVVNVPQNWFCEKQRWFLLTCLFLIKYEEQSNR